ncbi:MAG: hypothetical protein EOL97_13485 [Spirochaetia bacterium]|nr:hypothetical protein [Spirochaetia bacterium]
MVNKLNKTLKTVKLPLRNDTYAFHYSSDVDKRPVIKENWEIDVAQFFMGLYPKLFDEGTSISELQQRASFEALARSASISDFDDFLKIVSKLKTDNE